MVSSTTPALPASAFNPLLPHARDRIDSRACSWILALAEFARIAAIILSRFLLSKSDTSEDEDLEEGEYKAKGAWRSRGGGAGLEAELDSRLLTEGRGLTRARPKEGEGEKGWRRELGWNEENM